MGKLFWKFFLFLFLAQLATLAGTNFYFWSLRKQEFAENAGVEITKPAKDIILMASTILEQAGELSLLEVLKKWQSQPMPQVYVLDAQKNEIFGRRISQTQILTAEKLANSAQTSEYARKITLSNGKTYLLFVPDSENRPPEHLPPPEEPAARALVEAGAPPDHADHPPPPPREHRPPLHQNPKFLLGPMIAGSIVSALFAFLIAWYFSKPIKHLREAFSRATQGDLTTRISHTVAYRRDELADLARHFDTMAARLESLIQGQRRLMHHVSHELRSPLARMQIAIGLAKQTPEKVESSLERIQVESERMNGLIGELLWLSKLESGAMNVKKEEVKLSQLLQSMVEDAAFEAQERGIKISQYIQSDITMQGDASLLYSAIENVVRNAIKYSYDHGEVVLRLFKSAENSLTLTVSDDGSGVPESELEAIFQPFMRSSNSQAKDGYGVGLAIAKQIVEAHGGKMTAKNLLPRGFEMRFDLPLSASVA